MKYFTISLKYRWQIAGVVLLAAVWVFIIVQCVNFQPNSITAPAGEVTEEDMEAAEVDGANYKDGKGMITITCEYSGSGGVHVFHNGRMKLYITNGSKNLRVSAGDMIYVRGADLESPATVTITAVEGKIDASIVGESITVENLARKLVKIGACS